MRLFVAAELDATVRQRAAEIAERLRVASERDGRRTISWVAPANLHLTLQFIGEVDQPTTTRVADQLAPPFDLAPFEIDVSGVGTFPASGPPRVVWLGVTRGAAGLSAMALAVNRRLDAIGLPRDDRPFRAHLTLGRVKGPIGPRFREGLASAREACAGTCTIERVTLFESRLSPHGSTYSVVATSPLGHRPNP